LINIFYVELNNYKKLSAFAELDSWMCN